MTAPLLDDLRPVAHRFRLGRFDVTTILDGTAYRDGLSQHFGINQSAEAVSELAATSRLPLHGFESSFTPTLVNTGSQLVLFDTGNGARRRDTGAGYLRERMELAGYRPEDIDVVAFTHVHPDHIGGVREGDRLAFPNARYVIARHEFESWSSGASIPERRKDSRELFLRLIPPLADNMTFLDDGDDVAHGIRAVASFGHSPGHLAYLVESDGHALLIWGDLANHYVLSLEQPDWHVALDDDREMAAATRRRVLDMVASDRILAVGHHMPFPAVGHVARDKNGYRWLPLTYQMRT